MPEVKSAISGVKTGRKPTLYKGRPLTEVRTELAQEVADSKHNAKIDNSAYKVAEKAFNADERTVASAQKALDRLLEKPRKDKAEQKALIADARTALKNAKDNAKVSKNALRDAGKSKIKSDKAVDKAVAARDKFAQARAK